MADAVLRGADLWRAYGSGRTEVRACQGVSLQVGAGELLVVKGPSGSGKTTLLNLLGALDRPTSGQVFLDGAEISTWSERRLVDVRRHRIGYVFQSFGLIPILSAAENVEVPLRLARVTPRKRDARVRDLLAMVGLTEHAAQRPYELSGGQQQRVAIARALAAEPNVLIADEPTGQLDLETGKVVMDLIRGLVSERAMAAVVATHDTALIDRADRVLELRDGRLDYATVT
ncbi:MAG: ABC transporter ATP-binding protein [Actinomycetota bacterium]